MRLESASYQTSGRSEIAGKPVLPEWHISLGNGLSVRRLVRRLLGFDLLLQFLRLASTLVHRTAGTFGSLDHIGDQADEDEHYDNCEKDKNNGKHHVKADRPDLYSAHSKVPRQSPIHQAATPPTNACKPLQR